MAGWFKIKPRGEGITTISAHKAPKWLFALYRVSPNIEYHVERWWLARQTAEAGCQWVCPSGTWLCSNYTP